MRSEWGGKGERQRWMGGIYEGELLKERVSRLWGLVLLFGCWYCSWCLGIGDWGVGDASFFDGGLVA
jgi:hypothetical protein